MNKSLFNAYAKYFKYLSARLVKNSDWRRAISSPRSMINYFNRIVIILLGRSNKSYILAIVALGRFVLHTKTKQGLKGLAIILKISNTAIIKCIAGERIRNSYTSLGHCVGLTRSGLPKWIPLVHRKMILKGDPNVIRFWLSVCSFYRVLDYKGKLNLGTITSDGLVYDPTYWSYHIMIFLQQLKDKGASFEISQWEPRFISKSGPGVITIPKDKKNKSSFKPPIVAVYNNTAALVPQALWWAKPENKDMFDIFKSLAKRLDQSTLVVKMEEIIHWAAPMKVMLEVDENHLGHGMGVSVFDSLIPKYNAKLGIKEEPGKVRVFAMVDWWTQMLLRPLHLMLFKVLSKLPEDATFDQEKGVSRGCSIIEQTKYAASFDLSAATDRLPVKLQSDILSEILPGLGFLWESILVGRLYSVPKGCRKWGYKTPEAVRYAVGQPMGALSSWAMLAITHHFIVQYAARISGHWRWFDMYQVLGDDIVIFDEKVAIEYQILMRRLGVKINLTKSVISKDSFEFAKRFISKGHNLSPISLREMDMASGNLEATILLFSKFSTTKVSSMLRFRGVGYKTLSILTKRLEDLPRRLRLFLVFMSLPGVSQISAPSYVDWFNMTSIGRYKEADQSRLNSLKDKVHTMFEKSLPSGWLPSAKMVLMNMQFSMIWADWGLGVKEGAVFNAFINDWRTEYLHDALQALMWPFMAKRVESFNEADAKRYEVSQLPLEANKDSINTYFREFLLWDSLDSLTPKHQSIISYSNVDVVKSRVGRWLRWWMDTRDKWF